MTIENSIIGAIKEVGFPIVAFFLMWHFSHVSVKRLTDVVEQMKAEFRLFRDEFKLLRKKIK